MTIVMRFVLLEVKNHCSQFHIIKISGVVFLHVHILRPSDERVVGFQIYADIFPCVHYNVFVYLCHHYNLTTFSLLHLQIPSVGFQAVSRVQVLDLSGNVASLPEHPVFSSIPHLQELYLRSVSWKLQYYLADRCIYTNILCICLLIFLHVPCASMLVIVGISSNV